MTESRSKVVSFRVAPSEYAELKSLAEKSGVQLNDAFLAGARQYLEGGSAADAADELRSAVQRASAMLRDLS